MTFYYNSNNLNNISNENASTNLYLTPGVKILIIITAIVFALQLIDHLFLGQQNSLLMHFFALHPLSIFLNKFYVWQLLTSGFMHMPNEPFHIIFNMLTFYFFGNIVEHYLGTKRFIYFYLIAIVFASFAYSLCTLFSFWKNMGWSSSQFNEMTNTFGSGLVYNYYTMLGASGAVMAILVMASFLKPNAIVLIYFLIPMKLRTLIYVLIGIDLLSALTQTQGQVAVTAHLGGALFGFLYYHWYNRVSFHFPNLSYYRRWKEQFQKKYERQNYTQQSQQNNIFSIYSQPDYTQQTEQNNVFSISQYSQPKMEEKPKPEKKQYSPEVIDALLDKIRRYGIASLTQEEREILQEISNNYSNQS